MNSKIVYMDNNATTPVDTRVLDAMLPYFGEHFGNASSRSHSYGWQAETAVDDARTCIASAIGAKRSDEIIFLSGATESINLALKGLLLLEDNAHIITTSIEHKAVLDTCAHLQRHGTSVNLLPVDSCGRIDLDELKSAIRRNTKLVSVMLANNEIGTIQDISTIGRMCRDNGVLFHTDATQGVGKIEFDVERMHVDLASFSAHKVYGPKGVGALYISSVARKSITPEIHGGGHEFGYRSGTLNVPGIVGFGRALAIASSEMRQEKDMTSALKQRLQSNLLSALDGVAVNGDPSNSLPGLLSATFDGIEADSLLMTLPEVALSAGSACTSGHGTRSHVLTAIGRSAEEANATVRFGIGRMNTETEIDYVAQRCIEVVKSLRRISPVRLRVI